MSFSSRLTKKLEAKVEKQKKAVRMASYELFKSIILQTPVDTGIARNNWFPSIGRASSEVVDNKGNQSVKLASVLGYVQNWGLNNSLFFTNSLPYIGTLEYGGFPNPPKVGTGKTINGYSTQAPSGMVRTNTKKFRNFFRKI